MRGFLPAAGDAAARGEECLDALEELGLQHRRARSLDLVGAMQVGDDVVAPGVRIGNRGAADLAQSGERLRRARPRAERHLVGADVDDLRREQLDQLVEDRFENAKGLFARRVEAVVRKALHREIAAGLAGVAQLGERLQHRIAVPGHVDLRDHVDAEPAGQRDDVADRRLAVVAARRLRGLSPAAPEPAGRGRATRRPPSVRDRRRSRRARPRRPRDASGSG